MRSNSKCKCLTIITSNGLIRKETLRLIQQVKAKDLNLRVKRIFHMQVSSFLKECFLECHNKTWRKMFFLKQNLILNQGKLPDQTRIFLISCQSISKTKYRNSVQNTLCAKLQLRSRSLRTTLSRNLPLNKNCNKLLSKKHQISLPQAKSLSKEKINGMRNLKSNLRLLVRSLNYPSGKNQNVSKTIYKTC